MRVNAQRDQICQIPKDGDNLHHEIQHSHTFHLGEFGTFPTLHLMVNTVDQKDHVQYDKYDRNDYEFDVAESDRFRVAFFIISGIVSHDESVTSSASRKNIIQINCGYLLVICVMTKWCDTSFCF